LFLVLDQCFLAKSPKSKEKQLNVSKNKYLDVFNYTWYFCVGRENDRIECPEHQNNSSSSASVIKSVILSKIALNEKKTTNLRVFLPKR
jgi:hypothetical protein